MHVISTSVCILLLAAAGDGVRAQAVCPNNWHVYTSQHGLSTCVWLSKTKASWIDAQNWCQVLEGHLVEVGSPSFNAKLTQLINVQRTGKYWIGLTDMESEHVYKWTTSKHVAQYMPLLPGQSFSGPAKNCIYSDEKGVWGVDACKAEQFFICQRQAQ